jgi:hypothetical protein
LLRVCRNRLPEIVRIADPEQEIEHVPLASRKLTPDQARVPTLGAR